MGQAVGQQVVETTDITEKRRIIGLTGGIATGKSTASDYLASQYNLPILDADIYARQAVEKGSDILTAIAHRHGPQILHPDGTLNRPALGNIIFTNANEKHWLEQQIHPYVRAQFAKATAAHPLSQTLVYAIPLLFEANLTHLVTEIWVITCTPTQQRQRLIQRNNLTPTQAQERIEAQMPLPEKCKQADHVLDNSHEKETLFVQIDTLLKR